MNTTQQRPQHFYPPVHRMPHIQCPGQFTSPLRMKAVLAERERRQEELSLVETVIQPIESPSKALAPVRLRLPLDGLGRPYLIVRNPYEETLLLVKAAVERFREIEGRYPSTIVLSAIRRLSVLHFDCYYGEHGTIPYLCKIDATWDICLRGEARS